MPATLSGLYMSAGDSDLSSHCLRDRYLPAEPSLHLLAFSFAVFLNKGAHVACALSPRRIGQCQGHIPESPPIFSRLKSSQGSNEREPWWSESECLDRKSQYNGHWSCRLYCHSFFLSLSSFPLLSFSLF